MLGHAKFKRGLVFLAALTMLLSVFPVAGAGAKTFVQPFKKVASTHMYLDDISEYLVYLNNRLTTDYVFALNTGDSSFLDERTDIIKAMENCFNAIRGMVNCSGDVLFSIENIEELLDENMAIMNSFDKGANIDSSKANALKEVIGQIDDVDELISSKLDPLTVKSKINIMIMGSISAEVRKVQQVNASAAFAKDIITDLNAVNASMDKVMARVLDSAENKSKSDEEKAFKLSIYDEMENLLNQCEAIVNYVSEMNLTGNLNSQEYETFIDNYEKITDIIKNEIQLAVFT